MQHLQMSNLWNQQVFFSLLICRHLDVTKKSSRTSHLCRLNQKYFGIFVLKIRKSSITILYSSWLGLGIAASPSCLSLVTWHIGGIMNFLNDTAVTNHNFTGYLRFKGILLLLQGFPALGFSGFLWVVRGLGKLIYLSEDWGGHFQKLQSAMPLRMGQQRTVDVMVER